MFLHFGQRFPQCPTWQHLEIPLVLGLKLQPFLVPCQVCAPANCALATVVNALDMARLPRPDGVVVLLPQLVMES